MKKFFTLFISICISCLAFGATSEEHINAMMYQLNSETKTATLIGTEIPNNVYYLKVEETVQDKNGQTYTVTAIGSKAFSNCTILSEIILPHSVTTIGDMAFENCKELWNVTIPVNTKYIGNKAFANCSALTSLISFMQNPITISTETFMGVNIAEVNITIPYGSLNTYKTTEVWKEFNKIEERTSEEVMQNGERYFVDMEQQTASLLNAADQKGIYTLPESIQDMYGQTIPVTSIGWKAFENNEATEIHLPSSITFFDNFAFMSCRNLEYVNLPANITNIGGGTFASCIKLKTIDCYAQNPPITGELIFLATNAAQITLIVPQGCLEAYKNHEGWKTCGKIIERPSTAVNEVTDAPVFSVENGQIITEGPVTIYNLMGQDVTAQNGDLNGVYILVQDGQAVKVLVK